GVPSTASPPPASPSRTGFTGSVFTCPATRHSAASCEWSRGPVARSGACRTASPPCSMPWSSASAAEWPRRSRHEPSLGDPDLLQDDRRARLPALRRVPSKPDLARDGNAPAADRDDRHDLCLPGSARARPLSRLRRAGRGVAGVLAERGLVVGDPILLGSWRWTPRALPHGAAPPGGDPAGHGPGRRLYESDAVGRRPPGRVDALWHRLLDGEPATGPRHFRADGLRPLLPRPRAGQPFPLLSASGLAAGGCASRADRLPQWLRLYVPLRGG